MSELLLWDLQATGPRRLDPDSLPAERQLEDWLFDHEDFRPQGLTIVGRQLPLRSGKVDLLGVDPLGRFVVIEIKRGLLTRKALAQVMQYAAEIERKPFGELVPDRCKRQALSENRSEARSRDPEQAPC